MQVTVFDDPKKRWNRNEMNILNICMSDLIVKSHGTGAGVNE